MRLFWTCLLFLVLAFAMRAAAAQTGASSMPDMPGMPGMTAPAASATSAPAATMAADVTVTLSTMVDEQNKKQLIATVKRAGKPVENAIVSFGAKRTFGRLALGNDTTLDDGTAAIPFPSSLPGDEHGNLQLEAMVQGPLSQWGAVGRAILPGGTPKPAPTDSFPRALWSPSAPLGLIAAIAVLVGGAWGAYLFVSYQLIAIRRGASR